MKIKLFVEIDTGKSRIISYHRFERYLRWKAKVGEWNLVVQHLLHQELWSLRLLTKTAKLLPPHQDGKAFASSPRTAKPSPTHQERRSLRLSSLNFLLLWRTGLTWGSIVKRWHRKSGSMPGMSEVDHAKASRCRAMTSAIWSCVPWPRDWPSLNILPPIYLSRTSPAGSGRLSRVISTLVTPSSPRARVVTVNTPLFVLRLFS